MNRLRTKLLLLLLVCIATAAAAQNIPNPVLPGVADAGVMKFNGRYYIGGVRTNGDFYVSDDLVNWGEPVHVLTMDNDWTRGTGARNNQIHANHIMYLNGTFHCYWSVNYWGRDRHAVHIVHAEADNALGPYTEPVKHTWMDNRIDPMVFRDDDGHLYMYMVRFTDGNAIWVRSMKNPREFDGEPVAQFASLPDTWETMDNRVAEGPWVMKYRDRYYMMYNANHTAVNYGNYQLGVAEAASPTGFQHGSKYSYPVVAPGRIKAEDNYTDPHAFGPDTLLTPGQPNILRGPNGFEWWLIYMANQNRERRGQFIDRVHFFDKTLFVDGITGRHATGYHPVPAMPTFRAFDRKAGLLTDVPPSTTCLVEAGVSTRSEAGITAWWTDADNQAQVGLRADRHCWYLRTRVGGRETVYEYKLPDDFRHGVYHTLRVERNMDCLRIFLDDIPAPGRSWFAGVLPADEAGLPGLYGEGSFDGVTYPSGFDDYDRYTPAWRATQGSYLSTDAGLQAASPRAEALKGNYLTDYELSLQVSQPADTGRAGIYALYVDRDNYVKAQLNAATHQLEVTAVRKGKTALQKVYPLARKRMVYPDVKYTDMIEKGYRLPSPTLVSAFYLDSPALGTPADGPAPRFELFTAEYLLNGEYRPMQLPLTQPVTAEGFRFINKEAEDLQRHIYKVGIGEQWKQSYNLRIVRRADRLHLFVDGRQVDTLRPGAYPASRIGLCSEGCTPLYNGILYYHIN
jgi:GH43 family beta-xylosidase